MKRVILHLELTGKAVGLFCAAPWFLVLTTILGDSVCLGGLYSRHGVGLLCESVVKMLSCG